MNQRTLNLLNLFGFIIVVTINALANILPFAGRSTADVSEFTDNLFVPAGFTFSIWGLIYLLLGFFAISAFVKSKEASTAKPMAAIGYLFLINCLINSTWMFAWHYLQIGGAMVLMLGLLTTLLMIYLKLEKAEIAKGSYESYSIRLPFRVYLGWISVATIANMAAMLTFYGFDGFGIDPQIWALSMMGIATVLGVLMLFKFDDFAFSSVIAWALWGIYQKRISVVGIDDSSVERGAIMMFTVVVFCMVLKFVRKKL